MNRFAIVGVSLVLFGCDEVFEIEVVGQEVTPLPTQEQGCYNSNTDDSVWVLDAEKSYLQYVTTKEENILELNQFKSIDSNSQALSSSIDTVGNVVLEIDLNDIQTNVDLRDTRMRDIVFETSFLPKAYLSFSIDPSTVNNMTSCTSQYLNIEGTLSLHGMNQTIDTEVLIVKDSDTQLSVMSVNPVIIDSDDFDLSYGVSLLKSIGNLNSISLSVPVYFQLNYNASASSTSEPVEMPYAPLAANELTANYDFGVSNDVNLRWIDNSDDEDGFIVRQKTNDGYWHTIEYVMADYDFFNLSELEPGELGFKVMAVRQGVTSEPTNVVSIIVNEASSLAN